MFELCVRSAFADEGWVGRMVRVKAMGEGRGGTMGAFMLDEEGGLVF